MVCHIRAEPEAERLVTEEAEDTGALLILQKSWNETRTIKGNMDGRRAGETPPTKPQERNAGRKSQYWTTTKSNRDGQQGGYGSPDLEGSPSDVGRGKVLHTPKDKACQTRLISTVQIFDL